MPLRRIHTTPCVRSWNELIKQHQDPDTALILSTGRLFLRNLSFVTASSDLRTLFESFGALEEVHLPQSKTGEPLGTAFLLFREPSEALAAYKALDKKSFQGRLLHILPGRAKPGQAKDMSEVTEGAVLGKV
jgi:multiple RNA-binding domain-containing protein 1